MCVVSAVGTEFNRTVPEKFPWAVPTPPVPPASPFVPAGTVSREEFNALKHEITELRKVLKAAKAFDEATGQPDCEMDEKVALIKRLAEMVGVSMEDIFN